MDSNSRVGRVIDPSYHGDQPNLRATFEAIGFDCLLDINKKICLVFALQFYKSVCFIRNLNGTLSIAFIIRNIKITLRLEEFLRILHIPCHGVYVFTSEWATSILPNGIDSNLDIYPPPHEDPLLISDALFYPRPPVSDDHYLVDHVMIPLFKRRVIRIMPRRKRPRLATPTPSESSNSTSSSTHQEEENDLVNNSPLISFPTSINFHPSKEESHRNSSQPRGFSSASVISYPT
ncbi:hypothetical protein Tco_1082833 [Tanacetum coccineum]|uniref:Uncharacterized protein n=1 Tax=Tanacetum coccineum TaxID=301880 RepID=A0ABQ5I1R5_9ASTR